MRKSAFVRLTPEPRAELTARRERAALHGRNRRHFPILLRADEGRTDEPIAVTTGARRSTVERHRIRFARAGWEAALTDQPRSGAPAQRDGQPAAMIIALAGSDAPAGPARWTAQRRAHRAVEWEVVASVSASTVRRVLQKTR
jgi:putative transposase